jgi:hypothetical protein
MTLHAPVRPRCRAASVSCGLKGHPNGAQGHALGNPIQPSSSFSSAARRATSEHLRLNENQESTIETATPVSHQKTQIKNPSAPRHGGRALAHFGFFAYFRFFHLHGKICKKARFFAGFSAQMYTIPHTIPKHGDRLPGPSPMVPVREHPGASTFPLPTIPTRQQKSAKKPIFPRILRPKCTHSHILSHSIVIACPWPNIHPTPPHGARAEAPGRWHLSTFFTFSTLHKKCEKNSHALSATVNPSGLCPPFRPN